MTRSLPILLILLLGLAYGAGAAQEKSKAPAVERATYEYLFLAEALMRHERYAEARKELAGLLKRVKGNDYESALVLQTWAFVEIGDGRYPTAAKRLRRALGYGVLPAKVAHPLRFTLAQLYAQQERYRDAAKQLKRWFAVEPRADAQAHELAAQVHGALKQYKTAIKHARKALAATKKPNESSYRLLLSLYLQAGHWKSACTLLERDLLRLYPEKLDYWRQLAGVRMERKQEQQAASTLALAYRQGLLEAADIRRLAQLYLHLSAPHKAALLLRDSLRSKRLSASTRHLRLLAQAWQAAREPEAAINAYQRAGSAKDLQTAGELLIDLEQWKAARKNLRSAISKGGLRSPARVHLLLGISELRLQHLDQAATAFKQARQSATADKLRQQAQQWLDYLAETNAG